MYEKWKTQISYAMLHLMIRINEINNKVRTYGTDTPLYEAEIHMIQTIQQSEGISVTDLAEKLEVTKGAVSQILNRLEKKGMIIKSADPKNLSRLSVTLSSKGKTAYDNHFMIHEQFNSCVEAALNGADENEKRIVMSFLQRMESEMDEFEKLDR